jgi:hypothetical protein
MLTSIRIAILVAIVLCRPLAAADSEIDDKTLIAMAHRRVVANDLGMTTEQMLRRAQFQGQFQNSDPANAAGMPTILKRIVAPAGGLLVVRFRVPLGPSGSGDAIVIDAHISRDDFGDLTMEWRYNPDQSALERERAATARHEEQEDLDRRFPDRVTGQRAAMSLKAAIFPAQVQFQAGNYEDRDKDGIGDFAADFAILSGGRSVTPPGGRQAFTLSLLPKGFVENLEKDGYSLSMIADNEKGFWAFIVLPSHGTTLCIDTGAVVRSLPGVVQPDNAVEAKRLMSTADVYRTK